MTYIIKSGCHPVIHLVGNGDINLVVLMLPGLCNNSGLVTEDKLYCDAMVEQRNGPSWSSVNDNSWTDQLCNDSGLVTGDKLYCDAMLEQRNGPSWPSVNDKIINILATNSMLIVMLTTLTVVAIVNYN